MLTVSTPHPIHHDIILSAPNLQPSTKAKYIREIDQLVANNIDPRNRQALSDYARGLSDSSRSFLKAALRLMSSDFETSLQASASPDNIGTVHAQLLNLQAMNKAIKVTTPKGEKTHTWLSREQVEQITSFPDASTIRGQRDYIVLAILLAAGLRRDELAHLSFDDIHQQPSKSGVRTVLAVTGKGNKRRTIPISNKLASHLTQWKAITGDGYIVRAVNKSNKVNGSLSPIGIHNIVRLYGSKIGIPALDAHDLRRSYAMIGYQAGVPITQISVLLGHSSVRTTQKYLNLQVDLESTASDFIPLS